MLNKLKTRVDEIGALHSKLILLIGAPGSGKSRLLAELAVSTDTTIMKVGAELGRRLARLPQRQRALQANSVMRELADTHVAGDLLLLDNIELLFDQSLRLNPFDLLKHHAKARRVVAVWPGDIKNERLIYAEMGHPEYQEYNLSGVVPFELEKIA